MRKPQFVFLRRQFAHPSGKPSQSLVASKLFALLGEQLKAEADAEDGRAVAADQAGQRLDQTARIEVAHAVPEGADSRQNKLLCGGQQRGIRRYHRLKPELFNRACDRGEVAKTIIDDTDHTGSEPPTRRGLETSRCIALQKNLGVHQVEQELALAVR